MIQRLCRNKHLLKNGENSLKETKRKRNGRAIKESIREIKRSAGNKKDIQLIRQRKQERKGRESWSKSYRDFTA